MGLSRSRRDGSQIWAGFVDAVTTLLMVLMFVLTIFTVMQSMLRDTITTQSNQLSELNAQVAQLADALGLERSRSADLTARVGALQSSLSAAQAEGDRQAGLIASLTADLTAGREELSQAQGRIASFEAQVASLLAERDKQAGQIGTLTASLTELQAAQGKLVSEQEALNLALAKARDEISADQEAARLAAARREALEALIKDMRQRVSASDTALSTALSDAEKNRLADLAAAEALREKLKNSDAELTAMTLALEEQRKRAEETLTLLAAAQESVTTAENDKTNKAALLAEAQKILTAKDQEILKAARDMALLNQQMTALRAQLGSLQALLDASADKDKSANVQIEALGSQLNAALAQVAAEQKRRADLEEAERKRLALENQDLSKYRSEFFGQISRLLAGQPGVRVVGDRFVFDSEVLFNPGSADLAPEGQAQIRQVVDTLKQVVGQIPPEINWIIRVDGHTDNIPLSGAGEFADNWALSQGRALSVVKFMQNDLGFPPERLAAAGFGEYQPVATGDTPEARAQNRRIELKLTER